MEILYLIIFSLLIIILIMAGKIRSLSSDETSLKKAIKEDNQIKITNLQNFEAILKAITDGIIILDRRGNIIFSNKSFKALLKVDDHVEGKHFMEVIRNIDLLDLVRSAMNKMEAVDKEIVIRKSGIETFLYIKVIPHIGKEGEIDFLIVLLQDITKLKKLEKVRQDFVANLSHELKTPVTAIKGYAEALLDGAIDERDNAIKFIEIIKKQADRLSDLTEDLLTLSRIELGDIVIERENVSVPDLVQSVIEIFNPKAQKKGIKLDEEISIKASINGDRKRLVQMLINLIDNAIKFTEKGFVKVMFYKENDGFILSVKDTGIGIPKDHLPRIGERFYRVDKARSRELGGTGLGLAIVKHLVKAHGWNFHIESQLGEGTEVKIYIPSKDVREI